MTLTSVEDPLGYESGSHSVAHTSRFLTGSREYHTRRLQRNTLEYSCQLRLRKGRTDAGPGEYDDSFALAQKTIQRGQHVVPSLEVPLCEPSLVTATHAVCPSKPRMVRLTARFRIE